MNISKHKIYLIKLLRNIYEDPFLNTNLLFKGGTAAYIFYGLNRFSTYLDFDILFNPNKKEENIIKIENKINNMIENLGLEINDFNNKFYTLYWEISYEKFFTNIKIEISKRFNENCTPKINVCSLYGTNIQVVSLDTLIAQKLIATVYRKTPTNRDIYDIHFFLSSMKNIEIDYVFLQNYTGLNKKDFFLKLLNSLEKRDNKKILNGLGSLIPEERKTFIRQKLLGETKELIKMQLEL